MPLEKTPYGHLAGATITHVCILASHPHICAARVSLDPEQLREFAAPYGQVDYAAVWADTNHLGRKAFLDKWKGSEFIPQVVIKNDRRRYDPGYDMRVQANQFVRNFPSGKRTIILVVDGSPNLHLERLVREVRQEGAQVILLSLTAHHQHLSRLADAVIPLREVVRMRNTAMLVATAPSQEPTSETIVDALERDDPEAFAMVSDILGITTDTTSQVGIIHSLRDHIRSAQRLPNVVLALLAVLHERPLKRDDALLVPQQPLWRLLKRFDVPVGSGVLAIKILLEEGSLASPDGSTHRAYYTRGPEAPVHKLARMLWSEFVLQRPRQITDRILTALEIALTDMDAVDEDIRDELVAFLSLQSEGNAEGVRGFYANWGLDEAAAERFEQRLRDLLEEAPDAISTTVEIAYDGPKVAACLPRAANSEEPDLASAGLKQAS